ncbi:MAG: hypothetical protein ABI763_00045 [Bacteroidota bacterium]
MSSKKIYPERSAGNFTLLIFVFIAFTTSVKGQYRELIFYKFPVGQVKYFHKDETVIFKLKSDEKFVIRKGKINLITDTMYEVNKVRFRPENLQWITPPPSKQHRIIKALSGTIILSAGLATLAYGILYFPAEHLRKENEVKYHKKNEDAITYSLAGLGIAAISIPIYQIHPKRYSVSKRWRTKYQR